MMLRLELGIAVDAPPLPPVGSETLLAVLESPHPFAHGPLVDVVLLPDGCT